MIGNELEQSIISVFQEDLSRTYSINEISKKLKKAYPYINKKVNYFLNEGILKKITIGKSYLCFLNFESEKARILLSINELNKKESFLRNHSDLANIENELKKKYFDNLSETNALIVVFYEGELFFVSNDASHVYSPFSKKYKIHLVDKQEFQKKLISDEKFQKNKIIIFNISSYLDIIADLSEKMILEGFMKK
jgi:DNA-binding Lrp family transcriptional regulator